jgi:hypothetical protein
MAKLFFILMGVILGIGIAVFYFNVRKDKKTSVNGGGGAGDSKLGNDNQTT